MSDGSFHVEMPELPGFVTALRSAPQHMKTELMTAGRRISLRGEQISKANAAVATGHMRGTVYAKTEGGAGGVSAIWGASAEYARPVDQGRRAGAKMPPKGALLGWGGVTEENEFVIRRAIGRKGIRPRPFVTKAFNEIKNGFAQKEFSEAIKRVLAKIGGH